MKRILYYFIQFTWNIITNILGAIITLCLILTRHESKCFGPTVVTVVGQNWGGFSLGIFTIVGNTSKNSYSTLSHEYGHSLQGLILGPFWLLVVALPSSIRYHYRNYIYIYKGPAQYYKLPYYDAIWFEGTASKYGEKYSSKDWM